MTISLILLFYFIVRLVAAAIARDGSNGAIYAVFTLLTLLVLGHLPL